MRWYHFYRLEQDSKGHRLSEYHKSILEIKLKILFVHSTHIHLSYFSYFLTLIDVLVSKTLKNIFLDLGLCLIVN